MKIIDLLVSKIKWIKCPFSDEYSEFVRTAKHFSVSLNDLKKLYSKAKVQSLSDSDWSRMENTDSWYTTDLEKINSAMKSNEAHRDVDSIVASLRSGKISAPICIRKSDGDLYLVSGNTRLMISKAKKIRPEIVIIDTDW